MGNSNVNVNENSSQRKKEIADWSTLEKTCFNYLVIGDKIFRADWLKEKDYNISTSDYESLGNFRYLVRMTVLGRKLDNETINEIKRKRFGIYQSL